MFGRPKIQSWTETIYLQICWNNFRNTKIILTIIIIGTVVCETLAVFSMPQVRKTGQCLVGQCFADYCIEIILFWSRQPFSSIGKFATTHENDIMFPNEATMTCLAPSLHCLNGLTQNSKCKESARYVIFVLFWNVRHPMLAKEEECSQL